MYIWQMFCTMQNEMKWNESGFRPPLCTYRLNWARRTSWGWWDDWDDTVLQTQDLKFEPWRSEAEHATSRSRRLPTILTFTRGWGRNIFCFFQIAETGTELRPLYNATLFWEKDQIANMVYYKVEYVAQNYWSNLCKIFQKGGPTVSYGIVVSDIESCNVYFICCWHHSISLISTCSSEANNTSQSKCIKLARDKFNKSR